MACVRILIADDHELVRQGLRVLIACRPAWQICGEAVDGVDAIEKATALRPDIVLLDVSMPRMTGLEAAPVIRRNSPGSRILIVSQHDRAEMLPSALEAGACAFVSKSEIASNLLATIESMLQPAPVVAPPVVGQPAGAQRCRNRGASPSPGRRRRRAERLMVEQSHLLELIARGGSLDDCLRAISELVVHMQPGLLAAVGVMAAGETRIERIASSSFPAGLARALCSGCDSGASRRLAETALARAEAVTLTDLGATLHVTPVRNAAGAVIAAFLVCLAESRDANEWERHLGEFGARLASVAIERQRAEDMLRQRSAQFEILVEQAPLGVFLLDAQLRVRQVNPVARPAFPPIAELVGRDYAELLHAVREPEYAASVLRSFRHTLASGESHHATEHARPRPGSPGGHYDWRVERIPLPEGGYGLVCYFREVSAEMQARAALQEARDHLESRVHQRTGELEKAYSSLRVLSMRMMQLQDEDRRRIARDLHDSAGQLLAALGMELAGLNRRAAAVCPELADDIGGSLQLVQQLTQEIRTASYLLHPPLLDDTGLAGALRWYVAGLSKRSGIKISLELDEALGRLPRELEAAVFHIVQESLTNIHRHSGSKTAALRIARRGGRVLLDIEDAGSGISADKLREIQAQGSGVGIAGMRERVLHFNGDIRITSVSTGTRIEVTFPVEPGGGPWSGTHLLNS